MKKLAFPLLLISLMTFGCNRGRKVATTLPKPAHIIIILEENKAYDEIIGSSLAPTFTALSKESYTANFPHDYAITHPSEPNYLDLFSGSNQGVTGDIKGPAPGAPFTTPNLASSLIQNGYTFIGYSENQPAPGCVQDDPPLYRTKHCPWINWVSDTPKPGNLPVQIDLPFTSFPDSNHYNELPTVAFVTPNMVSDMHDGSPDASIPIGDTWFHDKMMPLVRWAANPENNAVVIVTWDEDDQSRDNNIALLVCSGLINGGTYNIMLNHYDVLKTVEDMYKLPELGESDSTKGGIDLPSSIWKDAR